MTGQTTSATIKDIPVRESVCCYCGSSTDAMKAKDLRYAGSGYAWRLASACIDARACTERARERDQRWTLTPAGRVAALAFIEQAEQLRLAVAS